MQGPAGVAQLVERNLAKVEVASSRLVSRSNPKGKQRFPFSFSGLPPGCGYVGDDGRNECGYNPASSPGGVAEWLCSGLQSRVRRFDSDLRLQSQAKRRPMWRRFAFRALPTSASLGHRGFFATALTFACVVRVLHYVMPYRIRDDAWRGNPPRVVVFRCTLLAVERCAAIGARASRSALPVLSVSSLCPSRGHDLVVRCP